MRIPQVDGPSVDAAPLPGARYATSRAAGAGALQQAGMLGQFSQQFGQYLQARQNQQDIDSAWRAETALKDDYLQFEQDELGKRGVDAAGAFQRSEDWWEKQGQKYSEGLNPRAQSAYVRNATALRQASANTLLRHERQQGDAAMTESANARIGSAIDMAISDPTPMRLENSRREIVEAVSITGNMAGLPEDARKQLLGDKLSLMHRGVVMQMIDSNPDQAKAYYYTNKGEINGGTQLVLEKALDHSGKLQKAQEGADKIMGMGLSEADAMKYAEQNYSGEDEHALKVELNSRYTTKKQGEAEIVSKAYGSAQLAVSQGRRVAANDWSAMDDTHRAAILERQRAEQKRREAEAEGKAVKTDFPTWDQLNRMVTSDPQGFAAADLNRWSDKISRSDLMQFGDLQRKIRAGDDKPVKDAVTLNQQLDAYADGLKLKANSPESATFRKSMYDAVEAEQQRVGKPLDYAGRQKVIDQQVMQMTVPGMIWDSTKPAYQLTPEERATARVKVPDADRTLIIQALRAKGLPVTEDAISELYGKRKAGK